MSILKSIFKYLLMSSIFLQCSVEEERTLVAPPVPIDPPVQTDLFIGYQFGTGGEDSIQTLAVDSEQNVYMVGYENAIRSYDDPEYQGDSQAFAIKMTPDRNILWKQVIDTSGTDLMESLVLSEKEQKLYVLGRTNGTLPGQKNQGAMDLFLASLDTQTGQVINLKQLGDERSQHPNTLQRDEEGNFWISGYNDSYVVQHAVLRFKNSFVMKVNPDFSQGTGSFWNLLYADTGPPHYGPMNITLGISVFGSPTEAYVMGKGDKGSFVKKLDTTGKEMWSSWIEGTNIAKTALLSPQGDLWVLGVIPEILAKLDPNDKGKIIDSVTIKLLEPGDTALSSMVMDEAGSIYVAGRTKGSLLPQGKIFDRMDPGFNLIVVKFTAQGKDAKLQIEKVWQIPSVMESWVTSMALDSQGEIILGGYTKGPLISADSYQGNQDAFWLRIQPKDFSPIPLK